MSDLPNHPELTREEWFEMAVAGLETVFDLEGYRLPPVKISCSWPGGGSPRKRMGECWACSQSQAGINEIFITPLIEDPVIVLGVLVHELCHAIDDCKNGHKAAFGRIARAVGLEGKLTHCNPGPALTKTLGELAEVLGPYPHSRMTLRDRTSNRNKTAGKFTCGECDFVFKVAAKHLKAFAGGDSSATLVCPACQTEDLKCELV